MFSKWRKKLSPTQRLAAIVCGVVDIFNGMFEVRAEQWIENDRPQFRFWLANREGTRGDTPDLDESVED